MPGARRWLERRGNAFATLNRLNTATTMARALYDGTLEIYPDCVNPGSLWSATTAKKQP